MSKFHEGELAVQKQAGVQAMARRIGQGIYPMIFDSAAAFLDEQRLIAVASIDRQGHAWASILTGQPGFLETLDETTLRIHAQPDQDDPLTNNLTPGNPIGLLAIDLENRMRVRVNGLFRHTDTDGFTIEANQVYGNCRKYIQARATTEADGSTKQIAAAHTGQTLTQPQTEWIAQADTFFIASAHPTGGADASHRGGNPGFIHVINDHQLEFPDYAGNMMFNTLGNIAANPTAGLLFLDFVSGRTLQLTGRATIEWDKDQLAGFPGAQRIIRFQIELVIENTTNLQLQFGDPAYSSFNPQG